MGDLPILIRVKFYRNQILVYRGDNGRLPEDGGLQALAGAAPRRPKVDEHVSSRLHRLLAGGHQVRSPRDRSLLPLGEYRGGCQECEKDQDGQATSRHGQNP
jgi:hypothetical protein